jgi:hypothetical protein
MFVRQHTLHFGNGVYIIANWRRLDERLRRNIYASALAGVGIYARPIIAAVTKQRLPSDAQYSHDGVTMTTVI